MKRKKMMHDGQNEDIQKLDWLLRQVVLPPILARERERVFRCWVVGCGSGQVVYWLAALLSDLQQKERGNGKTKIFATDMSETTLVDARQGLYHLNELHLIPLQYHKQYFEHVEQGYRVQKTLRRMVIFGQHDVTHDPPLPSIDLLYCQKNLSVYPPEIQEHIFLRFAFSLYPAGILVLDGGGIIPSDSLPYQQLNTQWNIYHCTNRPKIMNDTTQEIKRWMHNRHEAMEHTDEEQRLHLETLEITNEELQATNEEQQTANEELELTNEELFATINDLEDTIKILNARVIEQMQERQEQERLNQLRDDFLSIASHEIKNPLLSISIATQLGLRHMEKHLQSRIAQHEADFTHDIETIIRDLHQNNQHIWRLNRLVNDLLDVTRIRTARLPIEAARCNLAILIREATEEQRQLHTERDIMCVLPMEEVIAMVDAERIRQVVINYLTNALKYSAHRVVVTLSVEGDEAYLRVQDEGPGIAPNDLEQIWERFYRIEGVEVHSGDGEGLGLGLHISHHIIEQHQGQVGVESEQGKGSTFWFRLPLITIHNDDQSKQEQEKQ